MSRNAGKQANILSSLLPIGLLLVAACGNDTELKRQHSPPSVGIDAPADGEVFRQGEGIVALIGHVSDSFDSPDAIGVTLTIGDAAPTSLTPDDTGAVGTEFSIDALPLGTLPLTLTATDSDGDTASDTIDIVIGGPLGPPTVEITTPEDGASYTLGDPVAFRGDATDLTTPADDLVFTWTSSIDGEIPGAVSSDGQSALFAGSLSAGTHVVTLAATDGDGEVGSASITVVVAEEEVIAEPGDLVFSELMVNPEAVDDEVGEWVELYNTSGSPIDVAGYTFRDDDTDSWVLQGPILCAPHDYVVLCANTDPTVNGGIPCDGWFFRDSTGNGLALANGPDEVVLTRPDGVDIDNLHYDETWYLPGVATGLDPVWLDSGVTGDLTHWCNQVTVEPGALEPGTPGLVNDPCSEEM